MYPTTKIHCGVWPKRWGNRRWHYGRDPWASLSSLPILHHGWARSPARSRIFCLKLGPTHHVPVLCWMKVWMRQVFTLEVWVTNELREGRGKGVIKLCICYKQKLRIFLLVHSKPPVSVTHLPDSDFTVIGQRRFTYCSQLPATRWLSFH